MYTIHDYTQAVERKSEHLIEIISQIDTPQL